MFVRHALPGERVRVRVTEGDESSRFLRADAVEVLAAADGRVPAPCPHAGPGRCGGCDFQHVAPARQRELLADVVREQLQRLAGLDVEVTVQAVPPDDLGWRTRVGWTVDSDGVVGLRRHRSHEVEPVDRCLIAHPAVASPPPAPGTRAGRIDVAVSSTGDRVVLADGQRVEGRSRLVERVRGREFRVSGSGFWQVHPLAAETLVDAVLDLAPAAAGGAGRRPVRGRRDVRGVPRRAGGRGADGHVVLVEGDAGAVRDARRNLHDQPSGRDRARPRRPGARGGPLR